MAQVGQLGPKVGSVIFCFARGVGEEIFFVNNTKS